MKTPKSPAIKEATQKAALFSQSSIGGKLKKNDRVSPSKIRAICKITGVSLVFFATNLNLLFSAERKVANPSKFKVNYSLQKSGASGGSGPNAFGAPGLFGASGVSGGSAAAASIAVNILDERFYPIKAFVLRDVTDTSRVESLWDGRDVYGKESPAGRYYAQLSIVYGDGSRETKVFKFVK